MGRMKFNGAQASTEHTEEAEDSITGEFDTDEPQEVLEKVRATKSGKQTESTVSGSSTGSGLICINPAVLGGSGGSVARRTVQVRGMTEVLFDHCLTTPKMGFNLVRMTGISLSSNSSTIGDTGHSSPQLASVRTSKQRYS